MNKLCFYSMEQKRNFVFKHVVLLGSLQGILPLSEYRRYVYTAPDEWVFKIFKQVTEDAGYSEAQILENCQPFKPNEN